MAWRQNFLTNDDDDIVPKYLVTGSVLDGHWSTVCCDSFTNCHIIMDKRGQHDKLC